MKRFCLFLFLIASLSSCTNDNTHSDYEGYFFIQNFIYELDTPDEYNSVLSKDGLTYTIESGENVVITSLAFVEKYNPSYTPEQPIENQWLSIDVSTYEVTYIDAHKVVIDFNETYNEQVRFYYTFKYYQDN